MPIKIRRAGRILKHETFLFPCGEVGVTLSPNPYAYIMDAKGNHRVLCRIRSSNDIMELVMAVDALRIMFPGVGTDLILPYFPYGRQDRASNRGESASAVAFGRLIASMGFNTVTILDAHSDVTTAVLPNCIHINQATIVSNFSALNEAVMRDRYIFVSPDAGANKKTFALAKYFGHRKFIRADKLRDTETGEIKETIVYENDLAGQNVMIADDICDGGRTFIELAKALRAKNCGLIGLYVTHGAFTKGTDVLLKNGIDKIFTTNSYHDVWPAGISEEVVTLDIEKAFQL